MITESPNGQDQPGGKDDFLFGPGSIWTFSVVKDNNNINGCQIRISRDSKQNTMNIFWLIPQYIVITVAEVRSDDLSYLLNWRFQGHELCDRSRVRLHPVAKVNEICASIILASYNLLWKHSRCFLCRNFYASNSGTAFLGFSFNILPR